MQYTFLPFPKKKKRVNQTFFQRIIKKKSKILNVLLQHFSFTGIFHRFFQFLLRLLFPFFFHEKQSAVVAFRSREPIFMELSHA